MTEKDEDMSVIRVFSYEPGTKTCKQKRTIACSTSEYSEEKNLDVIRRLLVKHKVFGALDAQSPFCDTAGAEMSDQMKISVYRGQLGAEAAGNDSPKFYYKKKKVQTKTDNVAQEFLKKQLDLKLKNTPELRHMRAQLLQSAFQADKWTAAPAAKLSVVAELTERDWSVITRTNCLLSGQRLAFERNGKELKNPSVERTPFSAFKLRNRQFDSYEIAAPAATAVPGSGAPTEEEFKHLLAHIPRFRVDDSSYVTVLETQNSLQSSMAKSSFTQSSIEASASGGLWGASAAAKGGFSTKEGKNEVTANAEKHRKLHVIYSFPRVTVYLDASSLELTQDVKNDIKKVATKDDVVAFGEKYGHIFSQRVKLGGRLMSSHQSTSTSAKDKAESENSLKAAASVSISGFGFSASAEASHDQVNKTANNTTQQDFASNMSWEATGGNTALCNDPPQWCGTVGNFRNWRIVEQGDIIPLTKLISTFKDYENTEAKFHSIAGTDVLESARNVHTKIELLLFGGHSKLAASTFKGGNLLSAGLNGIISHKSKDADAVSSIRKMLPLVNNAFIRLSGAGDHIHSSWVMERWVEQGQSPIHPHGAGTLIYNASLPDDSKYLCATDKVPFTDGLGFLYAGPKSQAAWFTLNTPPAWTKRSGPLEPGNIVELCVRKNKNSTESGVLTSGYYQSSHHQASKIDTALAFKYREASAAQSSRYLKFKIDVGESW